MSVSNRLKRQEIWDLEASLGFLQNRLARKMKRALDARVLEFGLTATQYIVLASLWEEDGVSFTELGERLYLDSPTLTGIADRMERDGLLQRQRDGDDRRVVKVHLTAKGRNLRLQIGEVAEDIDTQAWRGFTIAQKRQLHESLQKIWENMNGKSD